MSLQKIVVLCLALAAVAGGVWYVTQSSNQNAATQIDPPSMGLETAPADDDAAEQPLTGSGSFASLMGLGKSITCDYSYADESGSGSGTGYFTEDRMRVDATMRTSEGTFDSHMINDGSHIYTWTDSGAETYAIKMAVPDEEDAAAMQDYAPEEDAQSQISPDQSVQYDCDRWSVDASVFVPPSNVDFMDMQAMMQDAMQNMPEGFEMPEGFPMPQ